MPDLAPSYLGVFRIYSIYICFSRHVELLWISQTCQALSYLRAFACAVLCPWLLSLHPSHSHFISPIMMLNNTQLHLTDFLLCQAIASIRAVTSILCTIVFSIWSVCLKWQLLNTWLNNKLKKCARHMTSNGKSCNYK